MATLLLVVANACTSRYALELFMHHDTESEEVNVEDTQIHANQALGDIHANWKLVDSPNSHVLFLDVGTRGEMIETREHVTIVFSFDRYVRTRLYCELPSPVKPGELLLEDRSLVQVLGLYDISPQDKLYFPEGGRLVIDSVVSGWMFATIYADYSNHLDDMLGFTGRFKANVKHLKRSTD
ncbi:hypothetical protein GF356_01420 [candidate division GN15 bacterium]|nr:hypothetical protein [candidate division GN15 bacterium]